MEIKKKKNRIILCLCSIFVLVASIFSFIPFAKDTHVVKADSVLSDYSFSGSNISSNTTFTKGSFSYNLFNFDNLVLTKYNDYPNSIDYINKTITVFRFYNSSSVLLKDFANLQVGTSYVFTFDTTSSLKYIYLHGSSFQWVSGSSHVITQSDLDAVVAFYGEQTSDVECLLTNFQFTESTSVLPYVPYQDSTQVNYEFDIRVRNANYTNFVTLEFGVDFKIHDSLGYDYAVVGSLGASTIYSINRLIRIAYNFLPSASSLYCYRYDYTNNLFDRNYYFELPYTLDYIESYNNQIPFNGNIKYIVLGSYKDRDTYFHFDNYGSYSDSTMEFLQQSKYNFISYVDENGNNLNFYIPLDSSVESDYFTFRTYFLSNENLDANVYNKGFTDGYVSGESNGYNSGYITGKNDGYNLGYNNALDNEKYSFTNLISSVIDVPVKAFTSLFNFEILGVNLSGFFLGLLTCCIVIGVVRLIL